MIRYSVDELHIRDYSVDQLHIRDYSVDELHIRDYSVDELPIGLRATHCVHVVFPNKHRCYHQLYKQLVFNRNNTRQIHVDTRQIHRFICPTE